jgi:NAD(P)-dependent dehydrogenase (short-subunit alcohol dehydrogenase family)
VSEGGRRPAALVTGARRGLGRGIALALADAGFDLALADLAIDDAMRATEADAAARGARVLPIAADVAELAGHAALVDAAWSAFGGVDCLVNNAGISSAVRGDLLEASVESFDRVLGLNLRGTFFLTQRVARRMVAETRDAGAPTRSIVVVSSANAFGAAPERADYVLSKTALSMMTRLFALRLAPHGIAVHEIRPGVMRTDMTAPATAKYDGWIAAGRVPQRRWGTPEDVGRTVAALAAGALPFTTGDAFHVDGGLHIHEL